MPTGYNPFGDTSPRMPSGFSGGGFGTGDDQHDPEPTPTPEPTGIYTRPSHKRPDDVIVVGHRDEDGTRRRIALVRVDEGNGTATVRLLNGNPREASSNTETQAVAVLSLDDLTTDEG